MPCVISSDRATNPIYRVFYGQWAAYDTTLLVEQVSHHPPITAYRIENKKKGLVLVGHNAQKTSFSGTSRSIRLSCITRFDGMLGLAGSIIVKQIGHAILTVTLPSGSVEEYLITLPRLRIDGIIYASPYIELSETSYIASSTGWVATVRLSSFNVFKIL